MFAVGARARDLALTCRLSRAACTCSMPGSSRIAASSRSKASPARADFRPAASAGCRARRRRCGRRSGARGAGARTRRSPPAPSSPSGEHHRKSKARSAACWSTGWRRASPPGPRRWRCAGTKNNCLNRSACGVPDQAGGMRSRINARGGEAARDETRHGATKRATGARNVGSHRRGSVTPDAGRRDSPHAHCLADSAVDAFRACLHDLSPARRASNEARCAFPDHEPIHAPVACQLPGRHRPVRLRGRAGGDFVRHRARAR